MIDPEMYDPKMEAMPVAERKAFYDRRVSELVAHAYASAPLIKEIYDRAGVSPADVTSVRDLVRLPLIDKTLIPKYQQDRPPFGGLVTVDIRSLKHIYVSPGPIYDAERGDEDFSGIAKVLYAAGFRPGDIVLNTMMYHMVPAGVCVDYATVKLGATVIPAGVGNTELQIRVAHDLGVTAFFGTPSFLAALIKRTEELGYDFRNHLRIRKSLHTAEMLPPSLIERFHGYGIACHELYGASDVGFVSYQCSRCDGMHIADERVVEIVDPISGRQLAPGEVGEVVVTSLNNTYPLIRFRTGDLSSYTDEPCSCGRTSNRLTKIMGRVGEAIKVRGMFVHPNELARAAAEFPEIANYQLVVSRSDDRDVAVLRVELDPAKSVNQDNLSKRVAAVFREICHVACDAVQLCDTGTIGGEQKKIVDQRTWD